MPGIALYHTAPHVHVIQYHKHVVVGTAKGDLAQLTKVWAQLTKVWAQLTISQARGRAPSLYKESRSTLDGSRTFSEARTNYQGREMGQSGRWNQVERAKKS